MITVTFIAAAITAEAAMIVEVMEMVVMTVAPMASVFVVIPMRVVAIGVV